MKALTRGKLSLVLAAMFLAGAVAGSLATVYGVRHQKPPVKHLDGTPGSDRSGGRKWIEERFAERLKLTEEQREQLKSVFAQLSTESGQIKSNSFCQMEEAIEKANSTLRPLLTEAQRAEFEKMNQERKQYLRDRNIRDRKDRKPEPSFDKSPVPPAE